MTNPPSRHSRMRLVLIFVVVVLGYGAVAWDRLDAPSPHFHFVDLAHSFMDGRLDSETPNQRRGIKEKEGDPKGYRDAIERTLSAGGWNDWASIRTLTLGNGTVIHGRFPWGGDTGDKRHTFYTVDGEERKVVIPQDLARTCGEKGRSLCDTRTHYVSFPPFPALIMMPAALVFGYDTNDIWVTILFGGLNAVLLFIFLELLVSRGHSLRSVSDNLWLTMAFAFGTVTFFSSTRGEVWFSALVFGVTLNLLFMLAALDLKRPLLAGLFLGLGVATRVPIAFCFVFFAWQLFFPNGRWESGRWGDIFKRGALFSAPILACAALLIAYNKARFFSGAEFGHAFLSGGAAERIRDHGMFSTYYLNTNISAALINMPRIGPESPFVQITKHGLGLFVTAPMLLLLFRPVQIPRVARAFWLAVICAAIPGLLYQNSGWEQFSYRFAMDYFPYLMALLALGARPISKAVKALIIWGVLMNLFGAITFGRMPDFYY